MKQFLKQLWTSAVQHPKTTILGAAGFAVQGLSLAARAGIHVGAYGPAQFLQLSAAISTLLLGAYAHDPQPIAAPVTGVGSIKPGN